MTDEERKTRKAESQKKWYEKNKARHIANVNARRITVKEEVKSFLKALKESTPCADCGNMFPHFVMDFDHLGDDKEYIISQMVGSGFGIESIQREIDKCELVCSNCHRVRTFTRVGMHAGADSVG